jgi:DNA-directed RNA polymerase specialized sigma24 family protein
MTEGQGSVTHWITDLRDGKADAASRKLWERYFDRLARLARAHLRTVPRGPADEEDVALSVIESFLRGTAAGRFPALSGRDDLWRLLVTITARKASNRRRADARQKRGGRRVIGEAALAGNDPACDDFLAQVVGREPTPEFAATVVDESRRLFGRLADDSLRVVALLKLEGYSNAEAANSLDCSLRTVERKLDVIRKRWLAEGAP